MRVTAMLVLLAGLACAGRAADVWPAYDPRVAFAQADVDQNGAIDRAEFQQRMAEVFYFADRNKDGWLDAAELKALAFPEDFTEDDTDKNGRVSMREFFRVRFHDFDLADTNQDGELSVDEVVAAFAGRKRR